jgi:hypothetical protein
MRKHRSEDVKEDLNRFRQECERNVKAYRDGYLHMAEGFSDAPEYIKKLELDRLEEDYKRLFYYNLDLHPFYVGKRWRQNGVNLSAYRIGEIEWDFPNLKSDRTYPLIKKLRIDSHDKNGKLYDSMYYEYPEDEDWFMSGFINRATSDMDDN